MDNTRAKKSGLSADIQKKLEAKYSVEQEKQCREWIEAVIEDELSEQDIGMHMFAASLKNGVVLCRLLNALSGYNIKFNTGNMAFKQMENIEKFLTGCKKFGLKDGDLFQTADLYECQNMSQVIVALYSLSSYAAKSGYNGPSIGVKLSSQNKREFSAEVINQGKTTIGLQMGTNAGASQAGMNIGKTRAIMD